MLGITAKQALILSFFSFLIFEIFPKCFKTYIEKYLHLQEVAKIVQRGPMYLQSGFLQWLCFIKASNWDFYTDVRMNLYAIFSYEKIYVTKTTVRYRRLLCQDSDTIQEGDVPVLPLKVTPFSSLPLRCPQSLISFPSSIP